MTEFLFEKATKKQAKLRASIFGPSGSGKTMTALRIASGMQSVIGGRIAVVDTEERSASKYSKLFDFDACNLTNKSVASYTGALQAGSKYDILIIDSLSHAWQELLQKVDRLAHAKYKGNSWSAWSEGTPEQKRLVEAILTFPGHLIATMRSKTEWTIGQGTNGKTAPTRVGLAPEQGKGIEYEFDLLIELSPDHIANVIKDRTGKFQDETIEKPGEDLGKKFAEWLLDGEDESESIAKKERDEKQQRVAARLKAWDTMKPEHLTDDVWEAYFLSRVSKKLGKDNIIGDLGELTIEELKILTTVQDSIVKEVYESLSR